MLMCLQTVNFFGVISVDPDHMPHFVHLIWIYNGCFKAVIAIPGVNIVSYFFFFFFFFCLSVFFFFFFFFLLVNYVLLLPSSE